MEWLIVCMVVMAGIIYVLMKKLDHVLELHRIKPEHIQLNVSSKPYALILGETQLADHLKTILESNKIEYIQIKDENNLDKSKKYNRIFAVSNDDLSNLMICIIVNHLMGDCKTIAICNHPQDRNLFEQNNIPYLPEQEFRGDTLLQFINTI
ncbi:MAG: hypothetical protein K0R34_2722 [Herbinix sp.]|jgi:hypothetical protein|nr:hypothetical protein [Herbinix sp.]